MFTFANGNKYDGEFKSDLREGYGIYTFTNGTKYEGGHKKGFLEGHGI